MDIHLLNALGITSCAIFKIDASHELECLTPDISWLKVVASIDKNKNLQKHNVHSEFLVDFFIDAEEVWKGDASFTLSSGFWSEQHETQTFRFEALAINSGNDTRYLVIKNVETQFNEKQQTLQVARELLLSHHEIVSQHEYIRHKLSHVLRKNTRLQTLVPPIQHAIHNLETGVVILDDRDNLVLDNQASQRLLLCNRITPSSTRVKALLSDIGVSSAFLPSLVTKNTPWQGELYWQPCDDHGVWLQVTIHPVLQDDKLTHWVYLLTDITHIHTKEEHIISTSGLDSLTKISNRNSFTDTVRKFVKEDAGFHLFIIDICEFKKINEILSYQSGDEILRSFAYRLQTFVGNAGFVARIGSNEFALIKRIDSFKTQTCEQFTAQLIQKLTRTYTVLSGSEANLGINIGLAQYPGDSSTVEELLKNTDIALQAAKYEGKNIFLAYTAELYEKFKSFNQLEAQLKKAIDDNALQLFLQPIIDLNTGRIVKCEALSRWVTADGEFISPDVFIPLAEKSELIFRFGEWLVAQACASIEQLKAAGIDIRLAINISGRQVCDLTLLHQIKNALEEYNLSAANLSIELTESVFIESLETVSILLDELRNMGVTVSIDDFGTGFSSLVYLKKLPIDELKIDRSFVSELEQNSDDKAIIQAIINLAKNLNIKIIAEGIETDSQHQFLQDNECSFGQGYLYHRPVAVSEFIAFAKRAIDSN